MPNIATQRVNGRGLLLTLDEDGNTFEEILETVRKQFPVKKLSDISIKGADIAACGDLYIEVSTDTQSTR